LEVEATMPLTIRRATPADAPVVVEFNRLLAEESEGKILDLTVLRPGVQAALADEHKALYFLVEEDGVVLGQTMLTFEWSDWRNGWIWWIQSVYVQRAARRRGVFRALYEHILQTARREPSVVALRLYVEEENVAAQQTYERLGMERSGYFVLERHPL
jgi:ribosomal protein S18 acetylase RimI-like enzyme